MFFASLKVLAEREEMKSALQMKSLRDEVRIADYVACLMHAVRELRALWERGHGRRAAQRRTRRQHS